MSWREVPQTRAGTSISSGSREKQKQEPEEATVFSACQERASFPVGMHTTGRVGMLSLRSWVMSAGPPDRTKVPPMH